MNGEPKGRLAELSAEFRAIRERLQLGGGHERIERQHARGKLTARERVRLLVDDGEPWVEVGLLLAHDLYEGRAPGAGVITAVGRIEGREAVVIANDATVKAGSWWPEPMKPTNGSTGSSRVLLHRTVPHAFMLFDWN